MPDEIKIPEIKIPEPTKPPAPVVKKPGFSKIKFFIYFIGVIIEILLFLRLIFKLTGADSTNNFINFIYAVTNPFVAPYGIFVFEPGTLIAMFVYALLAWGIAKIIIIAAGRKHDNQ